jgi:hypothetical protein
MRRGEVAEGHDGGQPSAQTAVDHRFIVIERDCVDLPRFRLDPRPFDREPVRVQPHPRDEVEVALPQLPPVDREPRL